MTIEMRKGNRMNERDLNEFFTWEDFKALPQPVGQMFANTANFILRNYIKENGKIVYGHYIQWPEDGVSHCWNDLAPDDEETEHTHSAILIGEKKL